MGKKLSQDEWMDIKPPFCILRVANIPQLTDEIVQKICLERAKGWWYRYSDQIVFEHKADAVLAMLSMHSIRDNQEIVDI